MHLIAALGWAALPPPHHPLSMPVLLGICHFVLGFCFVLFLVLLARILYKIHTHASTRTQDACPWFGHPSALLSPGIRPSWPHPGMPSCSTPPHTGRPAKEQRVGTSFSACVLPGGGRKQVGEARKQDHSPSSSKLPELPASAPSVTAAKLALGSSSG